MVMNLSREKTIYRRATEHKEQSCREGDHYIFVLLLMFAHLSFESSLEAE